jgi:transposase
MNDQNYRQYTKEFKLEALELLKTSGKSASQMERELGITTGLLAKWRRRYQVVENKAEPGSHLELNELEAAQHEIHRLQRELTEIAEEREILKKVVNIFSRRNA